ncbi:MAG: cell division protein SepF [Slackia sp.]|nr:cell division protein SepF [Slackia sp.]
MDLKIPKLDELKGRLDLKDRLGFKDASHARPSSPRDDAYDDSYDDGFDEEDYGEYAFDDNADYARDVRKDPAATVAFSAPMPKLVTADDVRAHTQYTPSSDDMPAEASPRTERASVAVEDRRPAASADQVERTVQEQPVSGAHAALHAAKEQQPASLSSAQTGAFSAVRDVPAMPVEKDPAPAQQRVVKRATRILTVIKPESYSDAERISKILKAGDVAVLSLRNTPDELGKRILDFSFGVACALDARVECVSAHVFALTRGAGLTEGETGRLRDQGLM